MQEHQGGELTSEEIKRVLQEAILRNYPNPERIGCPNQQTLRSVAAKSLPHEDEYWEHITHCSPCYQDFLQYRTSILDSRRTRRRLMMGGIGAAAAAVLAVLWLSGSVSPAPKVPSIAGTAPPTRSAPPPPTEATLNAVLNMEASPTRGIDSEPDSRTKDLQRLPRRRVGSLLIYLQFGSEPGPYSVQMLRDGSREVVAAFTGSAEIRDGLTVLTISPDLSPFEPGTYIFSVSRGGAGRQTCRVQVN
jgi:hypothetical protein